MLKLLFLHQNKIILIFMKILIFKRVLIIGVAAENRNY